jgi:hypothetical protein
LRVGDTRQASGSRAAADSAFDSVGSGTNEGLHPVCSVGEPAQR